MHKDLHLKHLKSLCKTFRDVIAGSLESANSSILAARRFFKEVVGKKNQDFMLIRFLNAGM